MPLLVSGNIDVENAPAFLELGAAAAMVDRNIFPEAADAAANQVITMRAVALTEVCADALGTPARISFTDIKSDYPPPPDSGIAQLFDDPELSAPERDGSEPLLDQAAFESVALEDSDMIALDPDE